MCSRRSQFGPVGKPEGQVIQAGPVLIEPVGSNRPQADQRAAEVVDNPAEEERQCFRSRGVGVGGNSTSTGQPNTRS